MTNDSPPCPRIIARADHPISRSNIDREALKVLYRLRDAGFTAYLVGGGVRDLLLGKTPKDFDISTDARPGQLRQLFRNSRIIGKRFRLVQVFYPNNKIIEVSTFRRQHEYDLKGGDQVLAADNTFGTPAEDAFRRDLTINALFYNVDNFTVIDFTGGMEDLENRVIRIIGDPARRITQDPARMLRAIRHAARSDFAIEPSTWEAITTQKEMLLHCPDSRIRDEIFKDFRGGACRRWAELAMGCGLFSVIFPFYNCALANPDKKRQSQESLFAFLHVIDRLSASDAPFPDALLFGLFLIPWAQDCAGLMQQRKGQEFYTFTRHIRTSLDDILGHLNINKGDKESITNLLCQLSILDGYKDENDLPLKLRRKSYYAEAMQFHKLYLEAKGAEPPAEVHFEMPPQPAKRSRARSGRSARSPAIATKTKGGIFGFKR